MHDELNIRITVYLKHPLSFPQLLRNSRCSDPLCTISQHFEPNPLLAILATLHNLTLLLPWVDICECNGRHDHIFVGDGL